MFIGEHKHQLDDKGRVILPAKFREGLGSTFIVTRGMDHCLFVYAQATWEKLENKVASLPLTRKDARAFSRFLFSGASECSPDKQGRILIPQTLRDYAAIERRCVIIGVSDRVEIWSEKQWEAYCNDSEASFEDLAEKMADLDL
ncbi:MraZ protein [Salsuginibacillus halophilus]|uniref:Transcriptional regulator MraZ n=1 Tax=Salsuginibacillus halophilus TaxID=517424 RepID=A0A2P8HX29_9BACI|nr:division/cell wall cluster transcriptional repressor MraZ [Salsuginibacillus halophilus]PSL50779.1 MraZ protein [Salsuginibacillus halophilus]